MSTKIKIGLVIIAGFLLFHYSRRTDSPKIEQINLSVLPIKSQLDTCLKSKLCLVAYVAPWCGACHQFIQQNKKYESVFKEKSVSVMYIVGADKNRSQEIEMKNNLGELAVLDTESHVFMKAHQIFYFPTVYQVTEGGQVLSQGSDAYAQLNQQLNSK